MRIDLIKEFVRNPFPLWQNGLTQELVKAKWNQLSLDLSINIQNYSTAGILNMSAQPKPKGVSILVSTGASSLTLLEYPAFDHISDFYHEHGLVPSSVDEIESSETVLKIQRAFDILGKVPGVLEDVQSLVRSIQVLNQDNPEIDTSYSHPDLPFTIFVSVCQDTSLKSDLRVAESILHEAMHLKLSLIEEIEPLVKPFTGNLYFSPWRDELRPAQGVLHGAFVFRAILNFYLTDHSSARTDAHSFIQDRIKDIHTELNALAGFCEARDLTVSGKSLVLSICNLELF